MKSIAIAATLLTVGQPSVFACSLNASNNGAYCGVSSVPVVEPGALLMAALLYVLPTVATMVGVIGGAFVICWMMWQAMESMIPQR